MGQHLDGLRTDRNTTSIETLYTVTPQCDCVVMYHTAQDNDTPHPIQLTKIPISWLLLIASVIITLRVIGYNTTI